MNKKRVALALAAALGINTLMVTVGQVGGQLTVAHAQNARLTDENDKKILESIKVNNLNTSVEIDSSNNIVMTLGNIATEDVSDVKVGTFTYEAFAERETIKAIDEKLPQANIQLVDWNKTNTGKLTLRGLSDNSRPGIYTGDITVTYKEGNVETYKVSLRKTPVDTLTFTTEVTAGNVIQLKNVMFNGESISGEELSIREGSNTLQTVNYDNVNGAVFNDSKISLSEGRGYDIVYKYGKNKEYELVSKIVITKEDSISVLPFATNTADLKTKLEDQMKKDFIVGTPNVQVPVSADANSTVNYKVKVDDKNVVSYDQTVGDDETILAGASLTLAPDTNNVSVDFSVAAAPAGGSDTTNYVGKYEITYGFAGSTTAHPDAPNSAWAGTTGVAGDYYLKIGNSQVNYFDQNSRFSAASTVVGGNNARAYLNVDPALATQIGLDANAPGITVSGLEHGYTSIPVTFDVDTNGINLPNIEREINSIFKNLTVANPITRKVKVIPSVVSEAKSVKTSVVVAVDKYDGHSVQTLFERTGETTGEITIKGGAKLLPSGYGNVASLLTVTGAQVKSGVINGDDLVFVVQSTEKLPSTLTWSFSVKNDALISNGNVTFNGQVSSYDAGIQVINFSEKVKLVNNDKVPTEFNVDAKFDTNVIPNGSVIGFENQNDLSITLAELGLGQKTINAKVGSGKYQGTYAAGIWVTRPTIALTLTADNATTTSVRLNVTGKSVTTNAINEVDEVLVQYRLKGATTWTDGTKDLKLEDVKKNDGKTISVTQSGLESGKEYEFRVIYRVKDESNSNKVTEEVIATATAKTNTSSNSTITGSGGTTTGTSTGSTTINVTTNNSTLTGTSASVTLPTSFRYDSSKTPVAVTFKYKDKDGKVVTETKEQFSNVTAKFNGDKVEVNGLVPGKNYDEITVDYTDNNGRTRSIILRNIQTSTTVESEKYLANVYEVVLSRPADEAGYHFHLNNLKNKKVSLREFLLNMLSEKEFIEKYKSTEEKIEGLYNAIVARSSDEAGKKFWVDEYKKVLAVYGSETTALKAIADRMVNENELKELADKMGVQW